MAEEQDNVEATEAGSSGGIIKTILNGLGTFMIVLIAATIAPLISSALGIAPATVVVPADADQDEAASETTEPPVYWPLKPALIVNFESQGESSFLQVEMEVMARSQATIDAVKEHTPALRDSLLMLLAAQNEDTVFSTEGKRQLRELALAELNTVLQPYVEVPLEAVYFTSFVAQ